MSTSPFVLSGETRWGTKYGVDLSLQDSLSGALVDHNVGHGEKTPMGSEWWNVKEFSLSNVQADLLCGVSLSKSPRRTLRKSMGLQGKNVKVSGGIRPCHDIPAY